MSSYRGGATIDLNEIRERYEDIAHGPAYVDDIRASADDIPPLLAEITRLRGELERVQVAAGAVSLEAGQGVANDLIAFLNARLDEDEVTARCGEEVFVEGWPDRTTYDSPELDDANRYLTRFGPARALGEVEAKRATVRLCGRVIGDDEGHEYYSDGWAGLTVARNALRHLTAVYSDHPDYQQEWAL